MRVVQLLLAGLDSVAPRSLGRGRRLVQQPRQRIVGRELVLAGIARHAEAVEHHQRAHHEQLPRFAVTSHTTVIPRPAWDSTLESCFSTAD